MNAAMYRDILEENLLQSALDLRLGWQLIFQQDKDPKLTAKVLKDWLQNNSVNALEWPSQSPDLNPIEHLWRDLKMAVQRHSPSNLTELERFCKDNWAKLAKDACGFIIQKTWGCNCCQRCHNKILSKGCEYLCTYYIVVLLFLINLQTFKKKRKKKKTCVLLLLLCNVCRF